MKARDVMVSPVVTVKPSSSVKELAEILLNRRISAVPVVDDHGKMVGIVSEGDLLHRSETGTQKRRSWWLEGFIGDDTFATEYVKSHACKVDDIMTRHVIKATPETPLYEIAALLEKHSIKRIPIINKDQIVGIVSRANLVQAMASSRQNLEIPQSDATIREKLLAHLQQQPWASTALLNITVNGGIVDLWGFARSEAERNAIRVAAEATPGVCAVNDNLVARAVGGWV